MLNGHADSRGIVYVVSGPRPIDELRKSIASVRRLDEAIPIHVWSDHPVDLGFGGVEIIRYKPIDLGGARFKGIRGTNFQRLVALKESPWSATCYLDNDVLVAHPGFFGGLDIARRFGLALPMDVPYFWRTQEGDMGDSERQGVDVSDTLLSRCAGLPHYMTALLAAVIFFSKEHDQAVHFLERWQEMMRSTPGRGQTVLCATINETSWSPYVLPPQFCAGRPWLPRPLSVHIGRRRPYMERRWRVVTRGRRERWGKSLKARVPNGLKHRLKLLLHAYVPFIRV